MLSFNTLPKLCVLVAFGLSATVTSAEVVPEQPKKESLGSGFSRKNEEPSTKPVEVKETTKIETQDHSETTEPPKYSVEWYLLPKPESRAALRYFLPTVLANTVPKNCNEPILPVVEKRIRKCIALYAVDWYLLPKPENRTALRYMLPSDLAEKVPDDYDEPIDPEVEELIRKYFSIDAKKMFNGIMFL
ncbi:SmORF protein [Babesia bovis T2Bo]|uniref:SmORF n=1 Tax=Babesia bovis TaxID=5865 RepID=A7AT36_BABBO|nr:SmORF protein [Babesia bovis T2Bo]EDO06097.1 SmORF protein [Babesia bovis T2Bo]|eukprot:XP_001609665.1 SmORF [Babesia bovis]